MKMSHSESATTERNAKQTAAAAAAPASMLDLREGERVHVTPTSAADQRLKARYVVMGRFTRKIMTRFSQVHD